jgi:hypothetical protein
MLTYRQLLRTRGIPQILKIKCTKVQKSYKKFASYWFVLNYGTLLYESTDLYPLV